MKKSILVIGANATLQVVNSFDIINEGKVNRVTKREEFASGKAINFARAIKNNSLIDTEVIQFIGGKIGEQINLHLQEENMNYYNIEIVNSSRVCTSCVDKTSKLTTELIGLSPVITKSEEKNFLDVVKQKISAFNGVAICGRTPIGIDNYFYYEIAKYAKQSNKFIMLDCFIGINDILDLKFDKLILKINLEELIQLSGNYDIIASMKNLKKSYNLRCVAVTNGGNSSYLLTSANEIYEFNLPELEILNPIGSGDTASAIFYQELLLDNNEVDSFKCALSAATANTLGGKYGEFDNDFATKYEKSIKVKKLC